MNNHNDMEKLIERTTNYGIIKNDDGTETHLPKLSLEGSIRNAIGSGGRDTWGADQIVKFYRDAKSAWMRGDLEVVADFFGVLV